MTHDHRSRAVAVDTESTYKWETRNWSVPINLAVTQLLKVVSSA